MKPSLQKLSKFLKLEAERGYDNRAVLGGLERMLDHWEAEARADSLPEDLVQVVIARLNDYQKLSPRSRSEALEGLWRRIQREANVNLPALPSLEAEKISEPVQTEFTRKEPQPQPRERAGSLEPDQPSEAHPDSIAASSHPEARAEPELENPAVTDQEQQEREEISPEQSPVQSTAPVPAPPEEPAAALNAAVTVLPGVGPRHAATLARLNLRTLGDMLYYFPRRYDDYTQLTPINRLFFGQEVTVIGTIQGVASRPIRSGRFQITEAIVSDGSSALRVTWFNQPWISRRLQTGMPVVLSGKIEQYLGRLVMNNPEWEPLEQQNLHTNRIVPVYPLTASITQRWLRRLMFQVVSFWAPRVRDPLPKAIRQAAGLVNLPTALLQAHFPSSFEQLKAARYRLAFDEIFLLQLGVLRTKTNWENRSGQVFEVPEEWLAEQVAGLPFELTSAQQRALADMRHDLASGRPMNRLLQGDVGSGKTVIAGLCIAIVTRQGAQAAFMAPTGILAEQHYKSMLRLLAQTGQNGGPGVLEASHIRLLVGATPETEKREIRQGLENGEIKLVIGTHALIEDPVNFANLQLIVVDEQHRFGVEQRAALRQKGSNPHLLVMTATPIPRSLALTLYGDLDLSVMDEMPPGRQKIETYVLLPRERERAYSLILSQIAAGRQAFVIYPLVEESEKIDSLAAVEEYERLQKEIFPRQSLGLLHGRMKAEEKDTVMAEFRDRKLDILVSTSVVEVGVDIPNATVMLIEGADRFGLAQLHQFRGRVGRGADQSYCLLIPNSQDEVENERLSAMVETDDGFVLAERDLQQRGPGEFLGTRQAGYSELRMASLSDVHLIEQARQQAQSIFEKDPSLSQPEHQTLVSALRRFWGDGQADIS